MRTLLRFSPALLLAAVLGAFATSCSIPIPQAEADPTKFYVLSTPAAHAAGVFVCVA